MGTAVLFAAITSSSLVIGGAIGAWRPPSREFTAVLLAFAAGALITAVAFELFEDAFEHGGVWRAGTAFLAGAAVFAVADTWIDRRKEGKMSSAADSRAIGFALLAGVTIDGIPEGLALGVGLVDNTDPTLLVATFVSNMPEAIAGARKMREAGQSSGSIFGTWSAAAALLALPVVIGYGALEDVSAETLSIPLGFAAGALLASLADTLMPEAYRDAHGNKWIAMATAVGFLLSFLVSAA